MVLTGGRNRRWRKGDSVLLLAVVAVLLWFAWRIEVDLAYQWNWSALPQYLVRIDSAGRPHLNFLILGLLATLRLSFWALLLALPIGVAVGLLRVSCHLFNRLCGRFYVGLLRNLPPLVLILIFYYFISDQVLPTLGIVDAVAASSPGIRRLVEALLAPTAQLEAFLAAIITLALFEAAYIAEIVRAGIESIDIGQWQAGAALGLRRWQVLRQIVLPQALRRMLPPLAGQFISTIKDSAIVAVISIQELTFQGMELMASTYLTFEIWITVALLYFVLTWSCSLVFRRLERRMQVPG